MITAPIIAQPQVAILSTDGVKRKPVVVDAGRFRIDRHPLGRRAGARLRPPRRRRRLRLRVRAGRRPGHRNARLARRAVAACRTLRPPAGRCGFVPSGTSATARRSLCSTRCSTTAARTTCSFWSTPPCTRWACAAGPSTCWPIREVLGPSSCAPTGAAKSPTTGRVRSSATRSSRSRWAPGRFPPTCTGWRSSSSRRSVTSACRGPDGWRVLPGCGSTRRAPRRARSAPSACGCARRAGRCTASR